MAQTHHQRQYSMDNQKETTARPSVDQAYSSTLYSAHLSSSRSMASDQLETALEDNRIPPLALTLTFGSNRIDNLLNLEKQILMVFASCLSLSLCVYYSASTALDVWWLLMTTLCIFLPSQTRSVSKLGLCSVVVSAAAILLSSEEALLISTDLFRSMPIASPAALWPYILSALSSDTDDSSTIIPTWWSHGALWICCMGLFHMAHRLCDLQDRELLALEQQHWESQQQVDQYLASMAIIRERFVETMAREIQEAVVMVMTTLEQFSPITVLNNTHELLSPCSMPVPVANISAIHTIINELGHIGSHLHLVSKLLRQEQTCISPVTREFDISELIQTVGDALAAMATKLGISVILYHMDNGLHCINVLGDEEAIKHGLMCLLRNIMEGCTPGACIEIGLNVESHGSDRLQITFNITHTRSHAIPQGIPSSEHSLSIYTTELLRYSGGTLSVNKVNATSSYYLVLYNLKAGSDNAKRRLIMERSIHDLRNNVQYASEPTLKELIEFIGKLSGVRMILYATEKSVFAKHLTSCLASWNVDISHMPTTASVSSNMNGPMLPGTASSSSSASSSITIASNPTSHKAPTPATEEEHIHSIPPTFLLIDNDIPTLERQLQDFRLQQQYQQYQHQQQQEQQQQEQQHQQNTPVTPSSTIPLISVQQEMPTKRNRRHQQKTLAIIYFSYLKDYRRVREVILQVSSASIHPPRVFIVPKPCGPRRFLTALHAAYTDAIVDPQFAPMATSPLNAPQYMVTSNTTATPPTPSGDPKRLSPAPRGEEVNYFSQRHASNNVATGNKSANTGASSRSSSVNRRIRSHSNTFHPVNRRMIDLSLSASQGISDVDSQSRHETSSSSSPAQSPSSSPTLSFIGQSDPHNHLEAAGTSPLRISVASPLSLADASSVEQKLQRVPQDGSPHYHATNHVAETYESAPYASVSSISFVQSPPPPPSSSSPSTLVASNTIASSTSSSSPPHIDPVEERQDTTAFASSMPSTNTPPVAGPPVAEHTSVTSPDLTAASASTTGTTRRNLKFKISNRKKKDKNKHTPWWSPPIKVLIVEDNMINQAILSTWMKKHNIKFEVASDGKQAVEKWKKGGFHLILMDIQLPVMSGIDATRTIRDIEKQENIGVLPSKWDDTETRQTTIAAATIMTASATSLEGTDVASKSTITAAKTFQSPVIIVALTASSHESDRQAALSAGCNDFLTKPVSLEWLEKKIMEWGCMQALIDVEGWRQWKRSSSAAAKPTAISASTGISLTNGMQSLGNPASLDRTLAILKTRKEQAASRLLPTTHTFASAAPDNDHQKQRMPITQPNTADESLSSSTSTTPSPPPSSSPDLTHGILLQGSSTLAAKRMTTKSRMPLRELSA